MCFLRLLKHSANLAYKIKDLPPGEGKEDQILEEKQVSEEMTNSGEQQSSQQWGHPGELVLDSRADSGAGFQRPEAGHLDLGSYSCRTLLRPSLGQP